MYNNLHWHSHIWIDLDETLALTFWWMLAYAHSLGKLMQLRTLEDIIEHEITSIPNIDITAHEMSHIWDTFSNTQEEREIPLMPLAKESIKKLCAQWKKLSIITARNEDKRKDSTIDYVHYHFGDIFEDRIFFVNHYSDSHKPKSEVCKELGITLMIDDNEINALDLAYRDIECILIEKPWNKWKSIDHPYITRVQGWHEII